jgi:hypothetical protein
MTFSEGYARQLRELHERDGGFGLGLHTGLVAQVMEFLGTKSLCDYGAGKQVLRHSLKDKFNIDVPYYPYDPAFPEYGPAKAAELVCCIEVLEHVEPNHLDALLMDVCRLTMRYGFLTVNTGSAKKVLLDGRNAHLIQKPISWWLVELSRYFEIQWLGKTSLSGFALLVSPRNRNDLSLGPIEITHEHSLRGLLRMCFYRFIKEVRSRRHL